MEIKTTEEIVDNYVYEDPDKNIVCVNPNTKWISITDLKEWLDKIENIDNELDKDYFPVKEMIDEANALFITGKK